jgi:hypothetical protein
MKVCERSGFTQAALDKANELFIKANEGYLK